MAEITAEGEITFAHQNMLGSTVFQSDASGNVVANYDYDLFGNVSILDNYKTNMLYTGQEYDWENLLHYYNARYYDSETGRFISKDPVAGYSGDLLSRNPYIYVSNNPLMYTDPSGEFWETAWDILNVGYDIGAGVKNLAESTYNSTGLLWNYYVTNDYERAVHHANNYDKNIKQLGNNAIDLGLDAGATLIPFVPAGISKAVRIADKVNDANKTSNAIQKANDIRKATNNVAPVVKKAEQVVEKVPPKVPQWKVGDSVNAPTANGQPAWQTVRARYWKNEAHNNPAQWSAENIQRMRQGKAPLDPTGTSLEIDHIAGRKIPNSNNSSNLRHMTKEDHIQRHQQDGTTNLERFAPPQNNFMPTTNKSQNNIFIPIIKPNFTPINSNK